MEHKNVHTKTCLLTAPEARSVYMHTVHTSFSYTRASIQPEVKPVEYLIFFMSIFLITRASRGRSSNREEEVRMENYHIIAQEVTRPELGSRG